MFFSDFRQSIIGLRSYGSKELLVELFYLTFVVVITGIQLLIFHRKYTRQFLWTSTKTSPKSQEAVNSNDQNGPEIDVADGTYFETVMFFFHCFMNVYRAHIGTWEVPATRC